MRFKRKMKPKWGRIHLVQLALDRKLKKHTKTYIDNVKMVSGELLENTAKYYMKKGFKTPIEFEFYENSDEIIISINNQEIDHCDMLVIAKMLDKINNSPNPYNLFIDRLQEILDNRIKGESKLGFLRITVEGGFKLGYEARNNKIRIFARKPIGNDASTMRTLDYQGLQIDVTEIDSYVKVSWIGTCRVLSPQSVIDEYLNELVMFVKGKKIIVTFELLESMNSSVVPPLLTFMKNLEEQGIQSTFLFDDNEDWQRASFKPLSIIVSKYKNIKIKPFSVHEAE